MSNHGIIDAINNINDKYLDEAIAYQGKKTIKFRGLPMLASAAACLCLIFGVGAQQYDYHYRVDSVVDIDINPSIELTVSKAQRVLSATALNEDAQIVLEGINLENVNLDIAVDAIIGSLIEHDYLNEVNNAINVCVENDDEEAGAELGQKFTEEIILVLEENSLIGKVQSQTHATNSELTELAAAYGVSEGKLALAKQASESTGMLLEETVELSIEELWELSEGVEGTSISKDVEEETTESTEVGEQVISEDTFSEGETEEVSSEAPIVEPSERTEEESIKPPSETPEKGPGRFPNKRPGNNNDKDWERHDDHRKDHHKGMGHFDRM